VEGVPGLKVSNAPLADLPLAKKGGGAWATAEGIPAVKSGFRYPGYEGNPAMDLFEYSNANGLPLLPHGMDRIFGARGSWAATHAEPKIFFQNPHVQFVVVNRPICIGCQGWISELAVQRGLTLTVLDPNGFWYFTPFGPVPP
jgi:hypothetical protein